MKRIQEYIDPANLNINFSHFFKMILSTIPIISFFPLYQCFRNLEKHNKEAYRIYFIIGGLFGSSIGVFIYHECLRRSLEDNILANDYGTLHSRFNILVGNISFFKSTRIFGDADRIFSPIFKALKEKYPEITESNSKIVAKEYSNAMYYYYEYILNKFAQDPEINKLEIFDEVMNIFKKIKKPPKPNVL